jgi:hypothetical protein
MLKPAKNKMIRMLSNNISAIVLAGTICVAVITPASADETNAKHIFKAMSEYMVSQQTFSFTFDATLELITSDLQKVDFASSGSVMVDRPDKIDLTRTGGFANSLLIYDGKTLMILDKNRNVFAKTEVSGSIDDLVNMLRLDYGMEFPAADLLSSNPYEAMMSNVTDIEDLGTGVIGGKECDHLAFRTRDTDWQIWIAEGDKPYPCRFTITSKLMAQAPNYTIQITEWKTGENVSADDFKIKPPAGAKEVKINDLSDIDEVSGLVIEGDSK